MKQSDETDIVCIDRVLKYVQTLNDIYNTFNINTLNDLESNHICQLAVTQTVTNIHQLRQKIRTETLDKMPLFGNLKPMLKAARNIASHDYYSLDFEIIYRLTRHLLKPEMRSELEATKNGIKCSQANDI